MSMHSREWNSEIQSGFNSNLNSVSVDAVRFGIQTLAPKLLGSKPDFVISGSNIGSVYYFLCLFDPS